jgi:hypothetical protein
MKHTYPFTRAVRLLVAGLILAARQLAAGDGVRDNGSVQTNSFNGGHARTASGNGVTVKVARRADLWTTTDGSKCVQRPSGTKCLLYDVAYGNGVFVAIGNEGALLTSPDGVSWTGRDFRTDERLRGILFGNGIFVAVGYAGTVITSKNGVRWKIRNSGTDERL